MKQSKRSLQDLWEDAKILSVGYHCKWVTKTTISFGGVNIEDQIETTHGILQRYVVTATDQSITPEMLLSIRISNSLLIDEEIGVKRLGIFTEILSGPG
jgi:hypothetical protein